MDRIAVCEAFYCYAMDYHGGQFTSTYAIFGALSRMGFRPSPLLTSDRLEDGARELYDDLVAGRKHVRATR